MNNIKNDIQKAKFFGNIFCAASIPGFNYENATNNEGILVQPGREGPPIDIENIIVSFLY